MVDACAARRPELRPMANGSGTVACHRPLAAGVAAEAAS